MAGNKNSGRKAVPAQVHRVNGNPSKKDLNAVNDLRAGTIDWNQVNTLPDCPDFLSDVAQEKWTALSADLHNLGLFTRVDKDALAVYCEAYAEWVESSKRLKVEGPYDVSPNGYRQLSVWKVIQKQAIEKMRSAWSEFGLTPSARSKQLQPVVVQTEQLGLFVSEEEQAAERLKDEFGLH